VTDNRSTGSSSGTAFELPPSGSLPAGRELAEQLVEQARAEGVDLVGPGGLLGDLTKRVFEAGLEAEMTDHLGYDKHDPAGRDGGNSRNGTRTKSVITDVGPVELDVPRDRDGSFEPKLVRKRQRRLGGVDEMVISLTAKGLTTGEVQAHLADVYGTEVSRETISKITDALLGEMAEWMSRPLERVYPVVFIDALFVKIRDGQVTNRSIYTAIGVTSDGRREILGLWAGVGGEGAKFWLQVLTETREPGHRGRLHAGVRRPQGPARRHRCHLAPGGRADLCAAPDPQHLPARQPPGLGRHGPRPAAHLHGADRAGGPRNAWASSTPPGGETYPAIKGLWDNAGAEFVPFLDYSPEIRRVIYSTNAIESLNARMRRATRATGHFPNDQAALKCLYLVIRSLDPTGKGPQHWMNRSKPALNAFAITLEGRLFPTA
jgi:putative transposase